MSVQVTYQEGSCSQCGALFADEIMSECFGCGLVRPHDEALCQCDVCLAKRDEAKQELEKPAVLEYRKWIKSEKEAIGELGLTLVEDQGSAKTLKIFTSDSGTLVATIVRCKICHTFAHEASAYCSYCGHDQSVDVPEKSCPDCGYETPEIDQFCSWCGHKF